MAEFVSTIERLGDDAVMDLLITRTITEFSDGIIDSLGQAALSGCANLVEVNLPNVKVTRGRAFESCSSLCRVNLPSLTTVGQSEFSNCKALTAIDLPSLTSVSYVMFNNCTALEFIRFQDLPRININPGFTKALETLVLAGTGSVCTLSADFLNSTAIASGTGYIYVPRALVDSYKSATNWSTYASQFRVLEDYTVDGTVTGELDETKI